MSPGCPPEKSRHWCFRAQHRTLKCVPHSTNIMKTTLSYSLSEHVHSSKATRIAGFSSAMLRHAEIKECNMFHLLYARNISPQRFD